MKPATRDRLLVLLSALLALSLALNVHQMARRSARPGNPNSAHPFLSPDVQRTTLELRRNMGIISFNPLRDRIAAWLSKKNPGRFPGATGANPPQVGVYVEDLVTGSWMGMSEKEIFLPLSLNKVLVAMAAMRKADAGEWKLDRTFMPRGQDTSPPSTAGPGWREKIEPQELTLGVALDRLLVESDNDMFDLLASRISPKDMRIILEHVGMVYPEAPKTAAISPKNYANILRSLYYATCLTRDSASRLLEIMSRSIHVYLLRAAIPSEIPVAHKFGIYYPSEGDPPASEVFLHDAGIVYYPHNPFLIVVMTRQMDRVTAAEMIREISKMTYTFYTELKLNPPG